MADDALIAKALEQIAFHDAEASRLKRWVNDADIMLGAEPRFPDASIGMATGISILKPTSKKWNPGAFFNKPLSTAVKMILVARYEAAGNQPAPASVDEIHEALSDGSFSFETSGADAQKNSIRISLGKNSTAFVRLPNSDLFALPEWFGKRPGKTGRKAGTESSPSASQPEDDREEPSGATTENNDDQEKAVA
jgi:hypothetical protein